MGRSRLLLMTACLADAASALACLPATVGMSPKELAAMQHADHVREAAFLLGIAAYVVYRLRIPLGEHYQSWRARLTLAEADSVLARPPKRFAAALAAAGVALFLYSGSLGRGMPSDSCWASVLW